MHNDTELKEKIADNALERKQLHEMTTLAAELRRLLVRYHATLKQEGMQNDVQNLEEWLETERKGHAPAGVITESGIAWLKALRDRLKLSADEAQRLEGEGGNPSSKEQAEKIEELLKTVRRIDKIIDESTTPIMH